ncbi:MAG: hypothetical protein ACI9UN_001993 [Granulosicoccus sp.]|jgi:uncharacterized protein (TIGR00255 family)
MLRSMTAYGRSSLKTASGEIVCELKSVNHRYLDISVRLPESVTSLEPGIRERVTKALQRGKVDVSLKHTQSSATNQTFTINQGLLAQLTSAADRVKSLSGSAGDIDPLRLLQWPGVLTASTDSQDLLAQDTLGVFELALVDFIEAREREGAQISNLLSEKSLQLGVLNSDMRSFRPAVIARQKGNWLAKLSQLGQEHDSARLEQELIYAAQRLDIDEELDRLESHCGELSMALGREDSVGRRLDFLMQEFNREANTLASKSYDVITTNAAVDMKVLIEQMREQVQNVE